jgi:hypothetical protein
VHTETDTQTASLALSLTALTIIAIRSHKYRHKTIKKKEADEVDEKRNVDNRRAVVCVVCLHFSFHSLKNRRSP